MAIRSQAFLEPVKEMCKNSSKEPGAGEKGTGSPTLVKTYNSTFRSLRNCKRQNNGNFTFISY